MWSRFEDRGAVVESGVVSTGVRRGSVTAPAPSNPMRDAVPLAPTTVNCCLWRGPARGRSRKPAPPSRRASGTRSEAAPLARSALDGPFGVRRRESGVGPGWLISVPSWAAPREPVGGECTAEGDEDRGGRDGEDGGQPLATEPGLSTSGTVQLGAGGRCAGADRTLVDVRHGFTMIATGVVRRRAGSPPGTRSLPRAGDSTRPGARRDLWPYCRGREERIRQVWR